jgi:hypothetical protein
MDRDAARRTLRRPRAARALADEMRAFFCDLE